MSLGSSYDEQVINVNLKQVLCRTSHYPNIFNNLIHLSYKDRRSFYLGCRLARGETTSEEVQNIADELNLAGVRKGFEYIEEEARVTVDYSDYQTENSRMLRTWTPGRQPLPNFLKTEAVEMEVVNWKVEGF